MFEQGSKTVKEYLNLSNLFDTVIRLAQVN